MYVKIKWQTGIQKTLHRFGPSSSLCFCDFYQQSRFLTACRRLEKLVLPTFLTQVFHPWWYETCTIIQQQFWMKECDILGGGSKHTLIPPTYFQGFKTLQPRDLRSWSGVHFPTLPYLEDSARQDLCVVAQPLNLRWRFAGERTLEHDAATFCYWRVLQRFDELRLAHGCTTQDHTKDIIIYSTILWSSNWFL